MNGQIINLVNIISTYASQVDEDIKKNMGIFYTDIKMVSLMYDNIEEYINLESKILDPCCGVGAFLLGALNKGYKNIYGIDKDNNAIKLGKDIFMEEIININTYDTLTNSGGKTLDFMKLPAVDLVIGNPPYVPIRGNVTLNSDIEFKKFVEDQFIKIINLEQKYFNNEIILFESEEEIKIYEKVNNNYTNLGQVCTGYIGRGKSKSKDAISGKNIKKFGFKNNKHKITSTGNKIFIQNIYSSESGIIGAFAGNLEARDTVTIITGGDENICRYLLGILHSRFCNYYLVKYCYNNSKLTMHTDGKYIKKIPIVMDINSDYITKIINIVKKLEVQEYLSQEWISTYEDLHQLIYKIYNLNTNEINLIEDHMRIIQSKRWFD